MGTPIKMYLKNSVNNLGRWALDLYSLPSGADINTANPQSRTFKDNETRLIKIIAFNLEDFDILTSDDIDSVQNINSVAGGSADMAFIAYNQSAFDIKVPIAQPILPQFVCKADGTTGVTFTVNAGIDDGSGGMIDPPAGDDDLKLKYKWRKYNSELSGETSEDFTITNVHSGDLATYKIEIWNDTGGTIILPVTLSEGGTPYYWNGTAWSSPYGAVVKKERGLVYTGDYSQTGNLVGCDCKVAAGANVLIPKGSEMMLYNELTVEPEVAEVKELDEFGNEIILVNHVPAATFTLENNASLVQINDVENSGEITVKRKADDLQKYDYVYWSSPVVNAPFTAIPGTLKFEWNTNEGVGNWVAPATSSMSTGRGYIARVPADGDYLATFKGVPNNGDIDFPVEKTSDSDGMDPEDTHWNLIGNPYPSSIDAEKFLTGNTNIEGAVYLWKHEGAPSSIHDDPFYGSFALNYGNQYIAYNATGSSNPPTDEIEVDEEYNDDLKIASGQGFFVKVTDDTVPVTFTNKMRYDEATLNGYNNSGFYRDSEDSSISIEKQLVWLNLSNETNLASTALIGYVDGATEGKDRLYDAYANSDGFNLYSLISEEEKMVIQGLPLPFVDTNTVPLGLELLQNGIYNIAIADVRGSLFEAQEQDIYLEDTYTGEVHDLRVAPYTFTGEAGIFNDRFVLRYTPSISLSIDEVSNTNTFAYIYDAMLFVRSSNTIKSVEVYDINGKQIVSHMSNDNRDTFSTDFNFAKGVYIVAIKLDNGSIVTKKLIN